MGADNSNNKWADYKFKDLENDKRFIKEQIKERKRIVENLKNIESNLLKTMKLNPSPPDTKIMELLIKVYEKINKENSDLERLHGINPMDLETAIEIVQRHGFQIFELDPQQAKI